MARKLQAPTAPRLPDPTPTYDLFYMQQLIGAIEQQLARAQRPAPISFTVTNRDTTALSLDVSTATLAQTRAFLGELAAALIGRNITGGQA